MQTRAPYHLGKEKPTYTLYLFGVGRYCVVGWRHSHPLYKTNFSTKVIRKVIRFDVMLRHQTCGLQVKSANTALI